MTPRREWREDLQAPGVPCSELGLSVEAAGVQDLEPLTPEP